MEEKRGRGSRIRQLIHIDIGMVIFFIILIYLFFSIAQYVTSDKTEVYEVRMGTLSDNVFYRGIALRRETIVDSRYSGRVNYYNKETDRVAAGGLAYSVDESGEIADYADANMQAGEYFTDADLENFRNQSIRFAREFNPDRFYAVYDYKSSSSSQAQKISNRAILAGIKTRKDPREFQSSWLRTIGVFNLETFRLEREFRLDFYELEPEGIDFIGDDIYLTYNSDALYKVILP